MGNPAIKLELVRAPKAQPLLRLVTEAMSQVRFSEHLRMVADKQAREHFVLRTTCDLMAHI